MTNDETRNIAEIRAAVAEATAVCAEMQCRDCPFHNPKASAPVCSIDGARLFDITGIDKILAWYRDRHKPQTCREWLEKRLPAQVVETITHDPAGCPHVFFGSNTRHLCHEEGSGKKCSDCWDQPVPEEYRDDDYRSKKTQA